MKKFKQYLTPLALAAAMFGAAQVVYAQASATPQELAELGKSLTPMGAIKAANSDGSIPAYDGGMCKPPANYKPKNGKYGAPYVDPFANDKVLYTITAQNLAQYASQLAVGTQELLKRNPSTFKLNVYQSRRTTCLPDWVNKNTVERAGKPKLVAGGVGITGAHAQTPFPIPKNGYEAMWNLSIGHFKGFRIAGSTIAYMVDANGNKVLTSHAKPFEEWTYWDNSRGELKENEPYWILRNHQFEPVGDNGVVTLKHGFLRADLKSPLTWQYSPGQRRVRLVPEFSYDGVSLTSGIMLYDEINSFDGKMDKYDFKLLGLKEMIVPYNVYKMFSNDGNVDDLIQKGHANPDKLRFEKHRVWVVEGTLKSGERHVHQKKVFYLDEDSWASVSYDAFDQQGKIHHHWMNNVRQDYDRLAVRAGSFGQLYDFNKGAYWSQMMPGRDGIGNTTQDEAFKNGFFTPQGVQADGVR